MNCAVFPPVGLSFHTAAAFHELFRNLIISKMSVFFNNMIKNCPIGFKSMKKGGGGETTMKSNWYRSLKSKCVIETPTAFVHRANFLSKYAAHMQT